MDCTKSKQKLFTKKKHYRSNAKKGQIVKMSNTEQKKCMFCGEMIAAEAKKCKYCGEIIDPTMREMELLKQQRNNGPIIVTNNNNNNNISSGNVAGGNVQPQHVVKKRFTYIILALFFGLIGVHNFYIGCYGRAIVQIILTCTGFGAGIVALWVLLEMITVKKDAHGIILQ